MRKECASRQWEGSICNCRDGGGGGCDAGSGGGGGGVKG